MKGKTKIKTPFIPPLLLLINVLRFRAFNFYFNQTSNIQPERINGVTEQLQ